MRPMQANQNVVTWWLIFDRLQHFGLGLMVGALLWWLDK